MPDYSDEEADTRALENLGVDPNPCVTWQGEGIPYGTSLKYATRGDILEVAREILKERESVPTP